MQLHLQPCRVKWKSCTHDVIRAVQVRVQRLGTVVAVPIAPFAGPRGFCSTSRRSSSITMTSRKHEHDKERRFAVHAILKRSRARGALWSALRQRRFLIGAIGDHALLYESSTRLALPVLFTGNNRSKAGRNRSDKGSRARAANSGDKNSARPNASCARV